MRKIHTQPILAAAGHAHDPPCPCMTTHIHPLFCRSIQVLDILMNCVAFVLPIKQAQWGGAGALTYLSLFGTIVMMIVSIFLTVAALAPVLKQNAARMTDEELAEARLKQLGIGTALSMSPAVGRSNSSISKVDRMWDKMEAMEQEIALSKKADELHEEEIALLKERLDHLDGSSSQGLDK